MKAISLIDRLRIDILGCIFWLVCWLMVDSVAAETPPDLTQEQQAISQLRRSATNIQYHKDGRVRLVRLSRPHVTNAAIDHLTAFSDLEYLAATSPEVDDDGFKQLAELKQLKTLFVSQSSITNRAIGDISKLHGLEQLLLADTAISDAGVRKLGSLQKLRVLDLRRTEITNGGLPTIATLSELGTLLLSGTLISDEAFESIQKLSKLRVLYLDDTRVTGKAIDSLAACESLQHLNLSSTHVDSSAVDGLAALKSLKNLQLFDCGIQRDGLERLRVQLPNTVIHADFGEGDQLASIQATREAANENGLSTVSVKAYRERMADADVEPDFQRHVIPLLGKLGCNGRACHGSFQGQGGFRLSMFGYDFDMDHENLVERIDLAEPAKSLILHKPTSADEHEGGKRFSDGGWEQKLLRNWIASGARGVANEPAKFVRLEVTPAEILFDDHAAEALSSTPSGVQLSVHAIWSDGTRENVTDFTRFESNDDAIAEVSPDGRVHSVGPGDTHVIAFYDNGITAVPVIRPVSRRTGESYPDIPAPTTVDELVLRKLRKLGIIPSDLCTDEEFLRRVSLDMIGTLPTPEEITAFCADTASDKRQRKIDELLGRPEYVTWWTLRFCDLTGSNAGYLGGTEMAQPVAAQWRAWIERRVEENAPWDKIVEGIVLARSRRPGQQYQDFVVEQSRFTAAKDPADFAASSSMPHFWYRSNINLPSDKALAFGYIFLGIRLECAQCHKHPYDRWSKRDFELFTEFFTRVKAGVAPDATDLHNQMREMLGVPDILNTAALRRQSYLRIAAEGRPIPWKEIYIQRLPHGKSQTAKLLGGNEIDISQYDDPRKPLMSWLLHEPNHQFAKAFVNRIWANYFNVGIIDPPDDLNLANPPSNAPLLDYLTTQFIANGYDIKWLHRQIAGSRTYQLSWRPNATNVADERNFSHAVIRRLPAEVVVDAMIQATANNAQLAKIGDSAAGRKIGDHPRSYQARVVDYSLLIFGKPLRTTNCDCERQNEPTLLQSLYVRNDEELLNRIDRADGWLAELRKQPDADRPSSTELVVTAYRRVLSRQPTASERDDNLAHISQCESPLEGLRDIVWALLNTQEFITNH